MVGNTAAARQSFDLAVSRHEVPAWYADLCLSADTSSSRIAQSPPRPRPADPGRRQTPRSLPAGVLSVTEFDKLKAAKGQAHATSGESVQHALLKIMEGYPAKLSNAQYIDTTNILFICGGAFVGMDEIMSKTHGYGFISTSDDDNQNILDRLNTRVKPTDLFEYGLIPEFTGRLPIIASFQSLTRKMLVRIMTEPKNSIYNQFREIFKNEGVDLKIEPKVFEQISEIAMEYKTGARSLRGIFEELINPVLYVVPDNRDINKVVITSLFTEPQIFKSSAAA